MRSLLIIMILLTALFIACVVYLHPMSSLPAQPFFSTQLLQKEYSSGPMQLLQKEYSSGPVHTTHPEFIHSAPFSKDLIVHSAHFDDRARDGYNNVTMFLIGVKKTIFDSKWIIGCGAGNKEASQFKARFTAEDILMHKWSGPKPYPYEEIIVECYDLPVVKGSSGFVMYKTGHDSPIYSVESEHPIYFPAPRVKPTGEHNFTVLTCSKVHDKGVTWLPEFVRYQRTLGVDHVHINILDTFIKDGGLQAQLADPYMAQAVKEGFLSFSVWIEWYDNSPKKEILLHSEVLRKLDCLYRFRGTYDYAFSLDTDDFFTPRIPGQTKVKDYILKLCYGNSIGSCALDWIYYFPGACGLVDNKRPDDGNITRKLRSFVTTFNHKFKSVHRTSALIDATFHDATCNWCLMAGYKVVRVPRHIAYMAHLRMNASPKRC